MHPHFVRVHTSYGWFFRLLSLQPDAGSNPISQLEEGITLPSGKVISKPHMLSGFGHQGIRGTIAGRVR